MILLILLIPQNRNDIETFGIQQEQYHNRKLEEDMKFCGTSGITVCIVRFAACLLVIGVIVGAFIAVAAQYNDNTAANTPTVTSSGGGGMTVYPFPRYTSTLDMFAAQINATEQDLVITMCPNTRIEIGTFRNPPRDDFNITDGDHPISLLRANATIQCGIDVERSNNLCSFWWFGSRYCN
jgi:hypothetical protein